MILLNLQIDGSSETWGGVIKSVISYISWDLISLVIRLITFLADRISARALGFFQGEIEMSRGGGSLEPINPPAEAEITDSVGLKDPMPKTHLRLNVRSTSAGLLGAQNSLFKTIF